ncbi:phage/plasmid primase, P4 family [Pseudoalteromonas sp. DL2-H2.2]|uniref:DNA primase family protein n=1 Tax=Pseudoalteromonas sp. DL2-H2.2 TaxID=2908889 RepID=UPI001F2BD960|nr:phage/plasmid primase, P4 family [Pseudoalteromonas sp. DL2-H2.2]MCF2909967.1 phage/plasmid primase, P4 family [Pseudoalteromonas sp. DL2-H2.2]
MDLSQVKQFIKLLTGSVDSIVTWQVFHDVKANRNEKLSAWFNCDIANAADYLQQMQDLQCGVYVCVNETDGQGRSADNVTRVRACFADFDGDQEPQWPIAPTFVTKRDETHGHAYWLLSDLCDTETFTALQKQIAIHSNTDHQVVDPCRVLRVPGTLHLKDPSNPKQYVITAVNGGRYEAEQIRVAFALNATQDAQLNTWLEAREGLQDGTGYDDAQRYLDKVTKWAAVIAPPAVLGSGSKTLFSVAGYAHDHGVSYNSAANILWEHYNPRCQPPWEDHEKKEFYAIVERAYKYATSAPGCKTAVSMFKAVGPVPEPVDGWAVNNELAPSLDEELITINVDEVRKNLRSIQRLGRSQGEILLPQLTMKSAHYDLALAFDGIRYDGCELIRCDKIFYQFNGKSWDVISDDVVKSEIQKFYAQFKPADRFTRGIYNVLVDLANVPALPEPNNDIVVFENGIVDVSNGTPTLQKHTPDVFTFNHCEYNYNRKAQCPKWHEFLYSIWPDDLELHSMLQEWFGYILTGDITLQKMIILLGKSRGGKGVIGDVMRALVGKGNVSAPMLPNLAENSALFSMSKSKLTLIPDAHSVHVAKRDAVLSTIKALTGGDPITYDVKFKDAQTTVFNTRLVLSTNNMPEFIDASGALVNRIMVFPFWKSFAGKEDPKLREKLLAEIEGIAQWAMAGLARLRGNGMFTEAESSKREKLEMKEDMFVLGEFVEQMTDVSEEVFTPVEDLHTAYRVWSVTKGQKPLSKLKFSGLLRDSELPIKRERRCIAGKQVRGFIGIRVVPGAVAAFSNVTHITQRGRDNA